MATKTQLSKHDMSTTLSLSGTDGAQAPFLKEDSTMSWTRRIWKVAIYAMVGAMCAVSALAQNATGSIVGRVTDPSDAVLVGLDVQIENVGTSEVRAARTNDSGDYTAPLLSPGTYRITVAATGFKTEARSNITLLVDQTVRADFKLTPGATAERIEVSAQAIALDTDSASVGEVIGEKPVVNLPLNGRVFLDLLFLTPGAVETGGEQSTFRYNAGDAIAIGGARSSSNGYTVDGTSIMDTGYNTPAYNISLDAIQEFKVQTDTYSAEFGYSANQINLSTKSGTNELHGSAFEFLRNDVLDARGYFNVAPSPVNPLRQNQFGYSFGAPVIIPKLYNGRNKTFIFTNYEGERIRQATTAVGNVPTSDELQGQFPFAITDPLNPTQTFPEVGGITTIPAGRISRYGQIVMSKPTLFFPAPNSSGAFNYNGSVSSPANTDQQNYRMDHNFSAKDSAFFHAAISNILATVPGSLTAVGSVITTQDARNYTLTYTHIFTPNLVNQARYGYLEALSIQNPYVIPSADLAALDLKGVFALPNAGYPGIAFGTYTLPNAGTSYAGSGSNGLTPLGSLEGMNDFGDSLSWSKRGHTIGAGIGVRTWGLSLTSSNRPLGGFNYDGEFSGNQISDFLLGNISSVSANVAGPLGNQTTGIHPHFHWRDYAPYFQDDWKVTPRLTVNLGLRYEFLPGPYEEQNNFFWFDPNIAYNGRRGPGPTPKNGFLPRIGVAVRPFGDNKTVIRGGFGMFYDSVQLNEYFASGSFWPYSASTTLTASTATDTLLSTDDLFPDLGTGVVTAAALTFPEVQPANTKNPVEKNWSFGIEREVLRNTVLNVNYNGAKGTDLANRSNPNQPTECNAAHNCDPLTQTPASIAARESYPNIGTLVMDNFDGYSNYNALNVIARHQSNGVSLLAAYTWSKGLDIQSSTSGVTGDAGGFIGVQDNHNPHGDYVGQRLAVSFVCAIPVGRGGKVLQNAPRALDEVIGGWQFDGIAIYQGGFPFSITATDLGFVNKAYGERADKVGNPYPSGFHKNLTEWFNTSAFAQPAAGDFGNSSRNIIRMPGVANWDLSLLKSFTLPEKVSLQFRFESFNAFNHPEFGLPNQSVTSGTFGTISTLNTYHPAREDQVGLRLTF